MYSNSRSKPRSGETEFESFLGKALNNLTTDQKVGGSNPSERAVHRLYLPGKLTPGSRKYIINFVTGQKKDVRPGVWKLRVSFGKNPLTGKYEYLPKAVKCGPRKADVES